MGCSNSNMIGWLRSSKERAPRCGFSKRFPGTWFPQEACRQIHTITWAGKVNTAVIHIPSSPHTGTRTPAQGTGTCTILHSSQGQLPATRCSNSPREWEEELEMLKREGTSSNRSAHNRRGTQITNQLSYFPFLFGGRECRSDDVIEMGAGF